MRGGRGDLLAWPIYETDGVGVDSEGAADSGLEPASGCESVPAGALSPESDDGVLDVPLSGFAAPERSLRAQPLPLKWTAGATSAFLMSPPQLGHTDGPVAWTECMTSTSCPQAEQT